MYVSVPRSASKYFAGSIISTSYTLDRVKLFREVQVMQGVHCISSRRRNSLMKFVFNLISPMIISRQSSYHLLYMACK